MNRKRRTQSFNGFGLVRTKTYITTRVPKIPFEKIKIIYGDHLHGSHGKIQVNSNKKTVFSSRVNLLISQEKKRQLLSYITYSVSTLLVFVLLIFIMNLPYSI